MMISKTFYVEGSKVYQKHLEILNGVLPIKLTDKEIDVLATIIKYGSRVNQGVKNVIRDDLGMNKSNVNKYIKSLEDKGFIIGGAVIPLVVAKAKELSYNFIIKEI